MFENYFHLKPLSNLSLLVYHLDGPLQDVCFLCQKQSKMATIAVHNLNIGPYRQK